MLLFTWLLMAYGFSQILVFGSIFSGLREGIHKWGNNDFAPFQFIGKFLSGFIACMMCTSTWVGFFLGLTIFSPIHTFFLTPFEYSWFFDGLLASGGVWAINSIIEWFENRN